MIPDCTPVPESHDRLDLETEYEWLDNVNDLETYDESAKITWSSQEFEIGISALLPLLRDQAHDAATIKHVMEKVKEVIQFLNPNHYYH